MNADDSRKAWQQQSSQTRLAIDPELLLEELRRKDLRFHSTIFWRDVREVGTSLLMVPVWLYMGVRLSLPWTWYLTVPVLVWVAGYMLTDRMRHKRQPPEPSEPLRQSLQSSLAQVEHQIWLLRNIIWWYLLPLALSMLAFFGQVAWQMRSVGWLSVLFVAGVAVIGGTILAVVYWLNQYAVRTGLEPRRRELETLLLSLEDETPDAS